MFKDQAELKLATDNKLLETQSPVFSSARHSIFQHNYMIAELHWKTQVPVGCIPASQPSRRHGAWVPLDRKQETLADISKLVKAAW